MPEKTAESTTAVLVVHGIGAQERGETVGKLLDGLSRVEGFPAPKETAGVASTTIDGRTLRFYEVYWADLLKGDLTFGAFQINELLSLSWFPWFNRRRGNYRKGDYPFLRLAWWCVVLPITNFLMLFAYYAGRMIAQITGNFRRTQTGAAGGRTLRQVVREATAQASKTTWLDTMLDEYVGDVFSYVNSAGDAFYRDKGEWPVPASVEKSYSAIVQRFYDQLVQAQRDGCDSIQIVAHSLGTVVTYHALSGLRFDPDRDDAGAIRAAAAKVRRLYTIGSPLEKIRFFWPRLVPEAPPLAAMNLQWDNFVSRFDPVAGALRAFSRWGTPTNHYLLGGGFFRSHVVYEHSPVFLGALAHGLTGRELSMKRTAKQRWWDWLVLAGETLLAPISIGVLLVIGLVLFLTAALLLPYLLSWLVRPFLPVETWAPVVDTLSLILLVAMVLAFLVAPAIRASRVHARHWLMARDSGGR